MNRRARILILILLPTLVLNLGCGLGVVGGWATEPASPLPVLATATPTPPVVEATSVPTPTDVPTVPEAVPTTETVSIPTPPPPPAGEVYVGEVELDMDALQQLQAEVDQGHQPWRLDPLEVARDEGEGLGFDPARDVFNLSPSPDPTTGQAEVLVLHGEHLYIIRLIQPVRVGLGGIWAIVRVEEGL